MLLPLCLLPSPFFPGQFKYIKYFVNILNSGVSLDNLEPVVLRTRALKEKWYERYDRWE
jgi:hypothetical protein